jgi:hypothetical protein
MMLLPQVPQDADGFLVFQVVQDDFGLAFVFGHFVCVDTHPGFVDGHSGKFFGVVVHHFSDGAYNPIHLGLVKAGVSGQAVRVLCSMSCNTGLVIRIPPVFVSMVRKRNTMIITQSSETIK